MPDVTISVRPNGPLMVVGPVQITDPTGKALPMTDGRPTALCRCGQSTMKPFCDGSHSRTGFQASDPAPAR